MATGWPVQANPPAHDQNHTRAAYARWLHAQQAATATPATHTQFDTEAVATPDLEITPDGVQLAYGPRILRSS